MIDKEVYKYLRENMVQTAYEIAKGMKMEVDDVYKVLDELFHGGAVYQGTAQFCMVSKGKQGTWYAKEFPT